MFVYILWKRANFIFPIKMHWWIKKSKKSIFQSLFLTVWIQKIRKSALFSVDDIVFNRFIGFEIL